MKDEFSINIRLIISVIAIACIGLSGMALAQNPKSKSDSNTNKAKASTLSSADKAFIKDAAKGGMMEVAMGRVAQKNASDSEVKNFGARMVKDHSKANEELKAIAKEENVEWPGKKEAGKWKSDKDYMDAMVKDHEKDLAEFEKEAKNGSDPNVKSFADKTAKTVREHLEMAKEIDAKLKSYCCCLLLQNGASQKARRFLLGDVCALGAAVFRSRVRRRCCPNFREPEISSQSFIPAAGCDFICRFCTISSLQKNRRSRSVLQPKLVASFARFCSCLSAQVGK